MKNDQGEFLLSAHWAKQGVELANAILHKLTINEEEKTVDTDIVTVSGTSTVAEGNLTGNAMVVKVPDAIQPASGALGTADISTFFQKKYNQNGGSSQRVVIRGHSLHLLGGL